MIRTVESVTKGHPDKVADQVSDAILDEYLRRDPNSRVAVETLIKGERLVLAGEVRSAGGVTRGDRFNAAQIALAEIGYFGDFDVIDMVADQSPEIAGAVDADELGAGDQGIMYGYATGETPSRLPLPQVLARSITDRLIDLRESGVLPWLCPDGKAQVTMRDRTVVEVIVSACHTPDVSIREVRETLEAMASETVFEWGLEPVDGSIRVNPAGAWTIGGATADCGVTGRKIMVDSYGGIGRHGGGAFSGKDPSKVDRSAAYAARQAARWLVDTGLASEAEVSLAYAIGVAEPVMVQVCGDRIVSDDKLRQAVNLRFDFRPAAIIERLDLLRPIYQETAANGHFGREKYSWEDTSGIPRLG